MTGRISWVTGAGTGIGRALAEALYRRGDRVAMSGRRPEALEEARRHISANPGGQLLVFPGDVSSSAYIRQVVQTVASQWGPIDLLINNAGVNFNHSFLETDLAEFRQTLEINALAAIDAIQAVLPSMRARRAGNIVNISSIYGRWGSANSAAYSVAKYALAAVTDVLQQDLVGSGVRVLGVYPGFIRTPMTAPFVVPGSMRDRVGKTPEAIARVILKAVDRRQRELYFPWYVPWVLRAHRWMPALMDRVAARVKR